MSEPLPGKKKLGDWARGRGGWEPNLRGPAILEAPRLRRGSPEHCKPNSSKELSKIKRGEEIEGSEVGCCLSPR